MKNNRTSISLAAKNNRSRTVSSKFRSYLRSRIDSACALSPETDSNVVMTLVDAYIATGKIPATGCGLIVQMIFTLLRPEIDKAIARSEAARQRAKTRSLAPLKPIPGMPEGFARRDPENPGQVLLDFGKLNRRERRRIEQDHKRFLRKGH